MFYRNQPEKTKKCIKIPKRFAIGYLKSPKSKPVDPRMSEEIFLDLFAKDLARKDIAIDAYKPNDGIV